MSSAQRYLDAKESVGLSVFAKMEEAMAADTVGAVMELAKRRLDGTATA